MRQSKILDEMTESRPLAKLEKENDEKDDEEESAEDKPTEDDTTRSDTPAMEGEDASKDAAPHAPHVLHLNHPHHHRKALLNPEDFELDRVGGVSPA